MIATRSQFSFQAVAATLFVLSVLASLWVMLRLVFTVFTQPGDTLSFMFSIMETRFLPSTIVFLLGCWSVAYLRWPSVWLQIACAPMAVWGLYTLPMFLGAQ